MHLFVVASLIAAATAGPVGGKLIPRAKPTGCGSMPTVTTEVAGAMHTLTGPFLLTAEGDWPQSGYYAHHGLPSIYEEIIFDISPLRKDLNATSFYMNKKKHLMSIEDGQVFRAWNQAGGDDDGVIDDDNVIMTTDATKPNKLECEIDATTCKVSCNVNGNAFSCAATPKFQPDWRMVKEKAGAGPGCKEMTVYAHPK